ncbi:DUF1780 domain-containing protein [Leptospira interrogans]
MNDTESEVLQAIRLNTDETCALFSNAGLKWRERTTVRGFLRALRINHDDREIIKRGPEPVDVHFRQARFQVTEILDKGRRRSFELKQRSRRANNADCLLDLANPWAPSRAMPPDELLALVTERSIEKARRYQTSLTGIDLLIYVNLQNRHFYPEPPFLEASFLAASGWRSVSMVMGQCGIVLWAEIDAPACLSERVGSVQVSPTHDDSLFA